jgi:hypothetical protein
MFKITKVVTDLSNEKYHSVGTEIISSSYLKGIYKHSIKRAKIPMESNDALVFGTQFHDICELGIQGFQDKYSVIPEKYSNKRTKLYKEYIEANPDAISIDDLNRLTKMFYNLQTNEFYRQLEDGCESHCEHSIYAEMDDLPFRIRPDKHYTFGDKVHYIIDYKTCQDVTQFSYDIKKYHYDLQAVFYADVLSINPSDFYFIAIEKNYPYTVQVFGLSEESIRRGRYKMDIAIDKIKRGDDTIGYDIVCRV